MGDFVAALFVFLFLGGLVAMGLTLHGAGKRTGYHAGKRVGSRRGYAAGRRHRR